MTLERLFPGRTFLGVGSGESLNETPIGDDWPSGADQVARMEEALELIRRLWDGETVTHEGRFYRTRDAKLWTRAARTPPLWVSAFGPKAAAVAARWGDGVWTLADPDQVKKVVDAYRGECDAIGREPGEIVLHALVSWAPDEDAALEGARMWKGAQPQEFYVDEWHVPREMYAEGARQLDDAALKAQGIISADPEVHVQRLQEIVDLGATVVVVQNNSGSAPLDAIRVYGEHVLPRLRA